MGLTPAQGTGAGWKKFFIPMGQTGTFSGSIRNSDGSNPAIGFAAEKSASGGGTEIHERYSWEWPDDYAGGDVFVEAVFSVWPSPSAGDIAIIQLAYDFVKIHRAKSSGDTYNPTGIDLEVNLDISLTDMFSSIKFSIPEYAVEPDAEIFSFGIAHRRDDVDNTFDGNFYYHGAIVWYKAGVQSVPRLDTDTRVYTADDGTLLALGSRHKEYCSLDRALRGQIGGVGQGYQVRIIDGSEQAIYTIKKDWASDGDKVRLTADGAAKIGTPTGNVTVSTSVVNNVMSKAELEAAGEYGEVLYDNGNSDIILLAPHGGQIEEHVDDVAETVGDNLDISYWYSRGYEPGGGSAYSRWHITSGDIALMPGQFEMFDKIAFRGWDMAIALHKQSTYAVNYIWGGGHGRMSVAQPAKTLIQVIKEAFDALSLGHTNSITSVPSEINGDEWSNIVNRVVHKGLGGIQIEFYSSNLDDTNWAAYAGALQSVLAAEGY